MAPLFWMMAMCLLGSISLQAQTAGDYRSNATTMNWSTVASWQKYNGTAWAAATDYPGQNACTSCTVTIQNGNTVTLNVSPANSVGNIVVGGGTSGTLTLGTFTLTDAGTLTVNTGATLNLSTGTFNVQGASSIAGTVSDASNTGINTFTGLVTKTAGSWTSTTVTTSANMVFAAGIVNNAGSFAVGAATIGAGATITANAAVSFSSTLIGQGALSVDAAAGLTLSGTTTIAGNLSLLANSAVTYAGTGTTLSTTTAGNLSIASGASLTLTSTGNVTIAGTTTIDGTFTDNTDAGVTTFTGLLTNNGTFNTDIVTTAGNLRINGGVTNAASGTFTITAIRLLGNVTATGTINIDGALTTGGNVVIAGGIVNITGSSNEVFGSNLTVSSGATLNIATTGTVLVSGATNIAGAIADTDNTTTTTFTGLFTNSGSTDFSALSTANIIFNGGITYSAGTFNVPTATISTNAGTDITATAAITFANSVNFTGTSTLTIAGAGGVTFSGTASVSIPGALTLNTGSALTIATTGNFTVAGVTTMNGSFTDNENTGVTTFTGLVTKGNGVFTSTAVTTPANMVFTAGFRQNGGTFNGGAASMPTGQTLTSTPVMLFNNGLVIGTTGNLTIAGSGGVNLGGTGIDYTIPGTLTLTGTLTVSTTGNFTVAGTTSMTGTGAFTDNNDNGTSTFTGLVTHNSTGRWTTTAVITASHLVFSNGFTNTAGTFSAGAATVADAKTLTGTVNMSFVNGLVVTGNGDLTVAGTATTGVTIGGTLIDYSFRNLTISGRLTTSTTGNLTVTGTTTISGTGNFLDNNNTGVTTFTGLVSVGTTATFTSTSVGTVGRMIFAGGITQANTTAAAFSAGAIRVSATQTWSGAGDVNATGVLDVNTGTLTNNITGTVSINGTLTGTTFIQGTNARLSLGSTNPLTITTLTSTASGNTVEYRANGNATLRGQTYHHLTISGTGNKSTNTVDVIANGNITINGGALSNTTNNRNIFVYGNWINNVGATAFTAGTGTVSFLGSATQTLGGTGATTFRNLTINNAAGVNQTIGASVTGVLNLNNGVVTTVANTLVLTSIASVTRTNGYVNGNLQKNVATGTNVTRTYEVGAGSYTPVTLVFASVSTAGDVAVATATGDQANIATSQLNASLSVNRNWTLTNTATVFTTYTATFNFVAGDKDASLNTANVIVGVYGSSWTYPTVGTKTATSTQATGLTVFGSFAIAEALPCTTPTIVITNPAAICSPATADLTAPAVTAGSTSGLNYTYWTDAAATIALSTPSAVANAGTYYIKGTVPVGGCADIKPVVVTRRNPSGVISGTATICTGAAASLSVAVTGSGPWSGTLSDGTAFSGSVSPITATVTPGANTTYTIATLTDGCAAQAADLTGSATVSLTALPTTADAGFDQSACGSAVTLAANTPTVGTGSWSIVSGTGGSFVAAGNPTTTFNGTAGVTYVLRWSISNSPCAASTDDVTITFTGGSWVGTVDNDINNPANWCGGILPTGTIDLSLPAGLPNYPAITDNIIVNHLTVATGAVLDITSTGTLTITGNYAVSGTIDNKGGIVLNGTTTQNFPGAAATIVNMKDVEVDNTAGVTINQSFKLTGALTPTTGTIDLSDKIITLGSDSITTARVAAVGGAFDYSGGGKFVVQRYIPAKRSWRLMTAPLTSSNTFYDAWQNSGVYAPGAGTLVTGPGGGNGLDANASSSLKLWDVNTQTLVAVTNTNNPISLGASGNSDNTGYFIFIRGDRNTSNFSTGNTNVTTLSSAGRLQTGPQAFTAAAVAGQFTLVGNPYASPVDFTNVSRTNLVKRFYVWDPSLNTVGGYVMLDDLDNDGVFSKSVVGSSQTKMIQSQQAFFVETVATGAASITFNESNKSDITSNAGFRPSAGNENISVELYLLNADNSTQLADGIQAEFNDLFSSQVNVEDAIKFSNVNETFALLRSGTALALERRPLVVGADTLFFKLTKTTQRNYQFRIASNNLSNNGFIAQLKDNYLGTLTTLNLSATNNINFAVNADPASASSTRFSIIFKPVVVLPVTFTSVKAAAADQKIAVDWTVSNQTNLRGYELEKSADGVRFTTVNTQAATGNYSSAQYSWLDAQPFAGNNFYRVKSIDNNGRIAYSQIVKVTMGKSIPAITVYPNPVKNNSMALQFNNTQSGNYQLQLFAADGKLVYKGNINITNGTSTETVTLPAIVNAGFYQLKITNNNNQTWQQQVLVQ